MQPDLQAEQNKLDLLQARLSDTEKGYLFAFCQNTGMVHAIEKAMLYMIYEMGVVQKEDREILDVNWAFIPHNTNTTDEQLGKELRAKIAGLSYLDDAFKQIKKFGVEKVVVKEETNPALGEKGKSVGADAV